MLTARQRRRRRARMRGLLLLALVALAAAGHLLWHYGHVNTIGSAHGYLDNPDDAYMLPDGRITVADPRNCRVLILAPHSHRILRQYGRPGDCVHDPPHALASPNGDTPMRNGGMLISEIGGSWID